MSEQLKYILISAFITSLNILGGISMNVSNTYLVIQIGLTIFTISVCLIYVYHFSTIYRSKTPSDKICIEPHQGRIQTQPKLAHLTPKKGFQQTKTSHKASVDKRTHA